MEQGQLETSRQQLADAKGRFPQNLTKDRKNKRHLMIQHMSAFHMPQFMTNNKSQLVSGHQVNTPRMQHNKGFFHPGSKSINIIAPLYI